MATNSLDFLLNLRANTTGFDQGINGAKFAVNALVGAMAALGVGLGVKELAEAADSYAMLSAKIQQSTKDSGNLEVVPLFFRKLLMQHPCLIPMPVTIFFGGAFVMELLTFHQRNLQLNQMTFPITGKRHT